MINKNILLASFLFFVLGALSSYILITHYYNVTNSLDADSKNNSSKTQQDKKKSEYYLNEYYGFSFRLNEGEDVLPCPNKNEYNDNIAVEIVLSNYQVDDATLVCAKEGAFESVFATKKDAENMYKKTPREYVSSSTVLNESYTYTIEDYSISGISGIRIKGKMKAGSFGPIPEEIDEVILSKNNTLYIITSDFYDRDFEIQ